MMLVEAGMKRASLIVVISVLVSLSFIGLRFLPDARATTLFVGGAGPGNHTAIQDAIDSANEGDTIYVYIGTYYENIIVDETLAMMGENRDTTIINGNATGSVVYISADRVKVTGLTLTNSGPGWDDAGIRLQNVQGCTISNNNLSNNRNGIFLYSSHNNTIFNNHAQNNNVGISLREANGNNIAQNTAVNNERGVGLYHAEGNTIAGNSISSNEKYGIYFPSSNNNTILNNTISWNEMYGIYFSSSNDNVIVKNNLTYNLGGIFLDVSDSNTVVSNFISSVFLADIYIANSSGNQVYRNNFMTPEVPQAYDETDDNHWDNGYPCGGNYWSGYAGIDEKRGPDQDQPGSDEIGDTPYDIGWGIVRDRYPLMNLYLPLSNEPPVCAITTPTQDSVASGIQPIVGTAYDCDGIVERVEIRIDDGSWTQVNDTTSWSYDWNTTTVTDGDHTIYARSYDGTDYSGEVNVTVVVDNVISPPPPKEESILQQAWFWIAVVIIVVVVLVILFLVGRRRRRLKGDHYSRTGNESSGEM